MNPDLPIELIQLRKSILTLGTEVEQRVSRVLTSLETRDIDLAWKIRKSDSEIDVQEVDIEENCLRVLALYHPVASDLRFILAVLRINTEFERIADLAKSIAKRVIDLDRLDESMPLPKQLLEMGQGAKGMLNEVLSALTDDDSDRSRHVRRSDEMVDDLLKEMFAWAQETIPTQVNHTEAIIDYLSIARKLERLADHTTNIAETVIFLIEGRVVRHSDE